MGALRRLLTDVLLDGRAPPWVLAFLHRRMLGDAVWRAHYHAVRSVERAAAGTEFSAGQSALVERMLLDQLVPERKRRRRLAPLVAFAGVAAAVALLVVVPGSSVDSIEGWTGRGPAGDGGDLRGVRVRCVDRAVPRVLAEAEAAPGVRQGGLVCPRGALLSFSVTNRSNAAGYVFVVGLSPAGELRWYAPFVEGASSTPMPAGVVDELLPTAADTSAMPQDGRVTLHALFSKAPLSGVEVARRIRGATGHGVSVGALERLPIDDDVEQGRLELFEAARP
ncbi:MAG: hypothetical protein Q8O67_07390 [Deltaproteobacteria bacterium]|nr:hypothetical protein [Deltaproteobacteria bacterium]